MALDLSQSLLETQDSSTIKLWDSTGVQVLSTNPGGYGGTNVDPNAIVQAQFTFKFDNVTPTTILDLVVASGTVTSGTFTNALGVVVDITDQLADLNISAFPFPQANPIELPATFFFTTEYYGDQYVEVVYTVTDGIDSYSSTVMWLLDATSCCCVKKAWLDYADGGCKDESYIAKQNAMNGLQAQNAVGNYVAARETLDRLKKLCCNSGCNGCGGC